MFMLELFTKAKIRKQMKCPLTDEGMKKMWYIHIMKYHFTLKRKETLPYAIT